MSAESKPCPICGSKSLGFSYEGWTDCKVRCSDCGTTGPTGMSEDDAVHKWNQRLSEDDLAESCRQTINGMLEKNHALNKKVSNLEAERQDVVRLLREICAEYGDNEWKDNLHLYDVIEKHLWRHLDPGEDGER